MATEDYTETTGPYTRVGVCDAATMDIAVEFAVEHMGGAEYAWCEENDGGFEVVFENAYLDYTD